MSPVSPGPNHDQRIAGVVLAGGASRRMGTPKALLRAGGETFLDRLCRAVAAGGCGPVLAVAGAATQAIRAGCRLDAGRLIENPDPDRGQISSIWCALDEVPEADGVLIVLVDQGGIEPGTVESVRAGLAERPVSVARYRGQPGHPTGFRRSEFDALRSAAAAERGARAVVEAATAGGRVAWRDVDDPGVVRNLNSPDDLERAAGGLSLDPR